MKLVILKDNLKTGINAVERTAGHSLSLPILNNVLLSTEKNFLNLVTTNLEIAISWWSLSKTERDGKTVIPARFFSNLINLFPKQSITLETKDSFFLLSCKNQEARLKRFNPEDFPLLPQIKNGDFVQVNNAPFLEGLAQVADIASPGSSRPEISGIFLVFKKDLVTMVATDSFRLAEKKLFFEKEIEKEYSLIVPQKTVRELINILSEKKGKLSIYFSPNQIMFEFPMAEVSHPQVQIISRLIEGEYPDYQEIIPKKYETQITLSKEDFLNQLKAAGLFCGKVNEVKFKIEPKKEGMEIFSQNPELGQSQSFIPGKTKGERVEISFNWRFLAEGLASIKSSEVIFELNGEEGPALLKPAADLNYLYVAMPIKSP